LARIRPANDDDDLDVSIDFDGIPTKPSWKNFNYAELVAATDDFNPGMNQRQIMQPFSFFHFTIYARYFFLSYYFMSNLVYGIYY